MKINKMSIAAAGVVSLALVAGAAGVAMAAVQANGSDGPVYMYDTNAAQVADGQVWAWDADLFGSSAQGDINGEFACPADSTNVFAFLADPGTERTVLTWKANAPLGFNGATKNVLDPYLSPISLLNGAASAAKAAGGNYSLGLACTKNSGVTVTAAFYRSISVTPITGAFTVNAQADVPVATPTPTPTPAPTGTQGTVALSATTTGAVNGVLALSVPAGAAATFGTPTLVNNKSTTTGVLGAVTVNDGRVLTANGWDLSADVADFKNSLDATNSISKTQLGVAPSITSTMATGVTAGAAQVAGAASYPATFASGAAANAVGDTVLDAGLTFVAPQSKAAGTYNSTLTLTVVSK